MNAYETARILAEMALKGEDGTVDALEDPLPTCGYYVGGVRPSFVVKDITAIDRSELAWYVGNTDARYYGVWVDSDDDQIYFDGVTHILSRDNALALAGDRGEIAIWGIAEGDEIRVQADQNYQDPEAAV